MHVYCLNSRISKILDCNAHDWHHHTRRCLSISGLTELPPSKLPLAIQPFAYQHTEEVCGFIDLGFLTCRSDLARSAISMTPSCFLAPTIPVFNMVFFPFIDFTVEFLLLVCNQTDLIMGLHRCHLPSLCSVVLFEFSYILTTS